MAASLDKKTHQPHDKFFRQIMSNVLLVKAFIQACLPEEVFNVLDVDSLQQLDSQLPSLQVEYVCRVNMKSSSEYILILIEHQSRAEKIMPLRMRRYVDELVNQYGQKLEKGKSLPAVIPLVFYTGRYAYPYSLDLKSLLSGTESIKHLTIASVFQLIQPEIILEAPDSDLMLSLVMETFELAKQPDENKLLSLMKRLDKLGDEGSACVMADVKRYLFQEVECRIDKVRFERLKHTLNKQWEVKSMPTLADMFREDGKREGKKEAKRELNMIVVNLLKAGLDIQTIQECTKLSYNAIKSLSKHETLSTH